MDEKQLASLLSGLPDVRILVVGDFFLDYYLDLDRTLSETSLETGHEAYQVSRVRPNPGAAGTVTSNLRALGVQVSALGVIGDDGMGYELLRGLRQNGVDVSPLIQAADRFTPTYAKPMMAEPDGRVHELNRLDIKNRTPMPVALQERIVDALREHAARVNGIVVADQVQEHGCGVVTDRVREALSDLARERPELVIAADSRVRIGAYRDVIVKPNAREAVAAVYPDRADPSPARDVVLSAGRALYERARRPVFVTIGAEGVLVFDRHGVHHVAGIRVEGPIDIVGAGDSTMSGIVSALCRGTTSVDAALLGNLVASVTIQQIGTTGTATPAQLLGQYRQSFGP